MPDETDPLDPHRLGPGQDWAFPPVEPADQLPAWAARLPGGPTRPGTPPPSFSVEPEPVEPEPAEPVAVEPVAVEPVPARSEAPAAADEPVEEPPSTGVLPVPRRRASGEPVSPLRALAGAAVAVAGVLLGIGALLWATDAPKGSPALQQTQAQSSLLKQSPAPSPSPVPTRDTVTVTPAPLHPPQPVLAAPTVPKLPLTVLNNSNREHLAARAALRYQAAGWPIKIVGAFRGRIPVTTVYYAPGQQASAQALQKSFPAIERVRPRFKGLPGTGLTVVLTRSYPA